jgi:hypothetical protein
MLEVCPGWGLWMYFLTLDCAKSLIAQNLPQLRIQGSQMFLEHLGKALEA